MDKSTRCAAYVMGWITAVVLSILAGVTQQVAFGQETQQAQPKPADKVLGLDTVIAFYGAPKDLRSPTFVLSEDWKYWKQRGAVAAISKVWFDLLQNPVDKGVEILTGLNFADNPDPVVAIDEFGFDYDGQIDIRTAALLREAKKKKPNLHVAVWQMRGPVAPKLAEAYRDSVDLVLLETYVGPKDLWLIAARLRRRGSAAWRKRASSPWAPGRAAATRSHGPQLRTSSKSRFVS